MTICGYQEDGFCVHPRNEGKLVICGSTYSFEQEASDLISRLGVEEALEVAKHWKSISVGETFKAWEEVVGLIEIRKAEGGESNAK